MPRRDIRLAGDELRALLAAHRVGVLASPDDGALVRIALDGDQLVFWSTAELAGRPVCLIVEEQPSYQGIRAAVVHGEARPAGDGRYALSLDDVASFDFGKLS